MDTKITNEGLTVELVNIKKEVKEGGTSEELTAEDITTAEEVKEEETTIEEFTVEDLNVTTMKEVKGAAGEKYVLKSDAGKKVILEKAHSVNNLLRKVQEGEDRKYLERLLEQNI